MTNPYQTPTTVGESPYPHRPFWRLIVGLICILIGLLPIFYGGLIVLAVLLAGSSMTSGSVSRAMILILGGLILSFGLGIAAFGLGLCMSRRRMTLYGAATILLSIVTYVVAAMFVV